MKLYVSTRKGLFTLERDVEWRVTDVAFLGDPVVLALPTAKGLIAALNLGHFGAKLRRQQDESDSEERWEEMPVPVYPTQPEGTEDVRWSLEQIWALEASGERLWAGTIPGGLFTREGEGEWTLVRSHWDRDERKEAFGGGFDAPGIHSVSIHPDNPNEILMAISCGGVWRSTDGAETWTLVGEGLRADYMPPSKSEAKATQDPHRIARCAASPDTIWMQHHNGAYRSTDGGVSWTALEVPPSSFGFAVAAHPTDPQTAWFVPSVKDECRVPVDGEVVVARTRDGGASFEVLREGLPQTHAYDLVFRHALDVDVSGTVLAFGSTTGSLWLSENGGDEWQTLSANLPPIYAVRFG
ncbi:MAG: exo-alpha-sialidase [Myxococcota bacterium]